MTGEEKARVRRLRDDGVGYVQIANELGISLNTIKSFCRRNNLGILKNTAPDLSGFCKQCGVPIQRTPKHKAKKYCSDQCRLTWWSAHKDQLNKKANYKRQCLHCGTEFESYGKRDRKFCGHACYINHRFGEVPDDVTRTIQS